MDRTYWATALVAFAVAVMAVLATVVLGQSASDTLFCNSLTFGASGTHWVSLPVINDLADAEELCDAIPNAVSITERFPESANQTHNCGSSGAFPILPGRGFEVVVSAATDWQVFGADDDVTLTLANSSSYLISLPFDTPIADAQDLLDEIASSGGSAFNVQRYDNASDGIEVYSGAKSQTPFSIQPGIAYLVRMSTGTNYTPSRSTGASFPTCDSQIDGFWFDGVATTNSFSWEIEQSDGAFTTVCSGTTTIDSTVPDSPETIVMKLVADINADATCSAACGSGVNVTAVQEPAPRARQMTLTLCDTLTGPPRLLLDSNLVVDTGTTFNPTVYRLPIARDRNRLSHPGFEPTTGLEPFSRSPGDPWIPGEWNAEGADVVSISTPDGNQALRINATGGSSSQVTQIIDVGDRLDDDCCRTMATFSALVNASEPTNLNLILAAGTDQTSVGTLVNRTAVSVSLITDGDPETWELLQGVRIIPDDTQFLELQLSSANSQIPLDGILVDRTAVVLETTTLADGGFEPPTALQPFFRNPGDPWLPGEWNAEDADLVNDSAAAGISPKDRDRMLRINATGGSASQVNQVIELDTPVSDLGESVGTWTACVNASAPTRIVVKMKTGDGQTNVGTLTNSTREDIVLVTDGDPDTWEVMRGTRWLPPTTSFLELEFTANNSEIPADGLFVDCVSVERSINRLTDSNFEPITTLQPFFRNPGDPWLPGEWNAEDANVRRTPTAGIQPFSGEGMLRINPTGGSSSQVNQIIEVPHPFGVEGTTMSVGIYVNTTAAAPVTLSMVAGDGQSSVGELTNPTSINVSLPAGETDADVGTWELIQGELELPAGTAFAELEISVPNAQIPPEGMFVDLARVTFSRCPAFCAVGTFESVTAQSKTEFAWSSELDWQLAQGSFTAPADIGTYTTDLLTEGVGSSYVDSASPASGSGFWYLFRRFCAGGSFSTGEASEMGDRDGALLP
ncbi:hypothetical protein ABI59_15005 [Acidobacteria bacterium Mor1]|nr:hypothetical protein ABI59_15005 [Acidobacteria bacterium Mor1]